MSATRLDITEDDGEVVEKRDGDGDESIGF